jgi:predicted phosphodiesterase
LRDAILLSHLLKEQNVQMVLHGHVHQNQIYTANERTKVFATASASNVAGHAPASYRLFEIKAGGRDWEVLASLKVFGSSITKELTRHSW